MPNVKCLPKQQDMRKVYGQTRILLVPSVWEEAFGRVASEAHVSGIPVIASEIGGLPESVGEGGIMIRDFRNAHEWIKAIGLLDTDSEVYQRCSQRGREHVEQFRAERIVKQLLQELGECLGT